MPVAHKTRVKETTATTGTGTYSLDGAVAGFQPFSECGTNRQCYYICTDGTDWEEGVGTLTSGAPWTMARTRIIDSSNSNSAVNWSAGNKDIFLSVSSALLEFFAASSVGGGHPDVDHTKIGALAIGRNATASEHYSFAMGTNVIAEAEGSCARGQNVTAKRYGEDAWAAGNFSGGGAYDAVASRMLLRNSTADATPTELFAAGTVLRLDMPVETLTGFVIDLIAQERVDSGTGDSWYHQFKGLIKRNVAGTTSLVGTVSDTSIAEDAGASGWSATITADDTNDALKIEVTGQASTNIYWVAHAQLVNTTSWLS